MTTTLTTLDIPEPPQRAVDVAELLYTSFGRLVGSLPGQPQRPMDLARAVSVDKSVAHRMITALAKPSRMGMLMSIPGPVPLADIAHSAKRLGVDPAVCAAALDAAAQFDVLVQSLAGDRATFDAMISDWVDEAREQVDTAARQSIFRGMKHVLGVAAETAYTAFVLHPSWDAPERGDEMALDCVLGLHRLRTSGNVCVTKTCDLRGQAVVAESTRTLLEEYCSRPTPNFRMSGPPNAVTCSMEWNGKLGRQHTCDVVIGEVNRRVFTYYRTSPERKLGGLGCTPWVPVRRAIIDLMLHRDVFPTCIPGFMVSRTGIHGLPDPNDPLRLHDRIRMACDIQAFGIGTVPTILTPEVPFYRKMLEAQCAAMGWDLAEFRAFRVRIEYPIFDSQMMFLIPLSEKGVVGGSGG